jgi:hypothetical protein
MGVSSEAWEPQAASLASCAQRDDRRSVHKPRQVFPGREPVCRLVGPESDLITHELAFEKIYCGQGVPVALHLRVFALRGGASPPTGA